MTKQRLLTATLIVCALVGGLFAVAPESVAEPAQVRVSTSNGGGGSALFTADQDFTFPLFEDQGKCYIDCLEKPDIVVEADSQEECDAACEDYCGGPCA